MNNRIIVLIPLKPFNGNRGAVQMVQANISNSFQNSLQGIGGPMTKAKTKRMKETLQGLIMEVHDKEVIIEGSKAVLEVFKTSPKIFTYLYVQKEE